MPKALDDRGFTAEVAAQRLRDAMTEYVRGANARMQGTDIELRSDEPNIVLPAVNLSLDTVISALRTFFRSTARRNISGDITDSESKLWLRLRLNGKIFCRIPARWGYPDSSRATIRWNWVSAVCSLNSGWRWCLYPLARGCRAAPDDAFPSVRPRRRRSRLALSAGGRRGDGGSVADRGAGVSNCRGVSAVCSLEFLGWRDGCLYPLARGCSGDAVYRAKYFMAHHGKIFARRRTGLKVLEVSRVPVNMDLTMSVARLPTQTLSDNLYDTFLWNCPH